MVAETCIHVLVNEGGGCWGVREGVRITLFSILTTVRLPSKIQKKKNSFICCSTTIFWIEITCFHQYLLSTYFKEFVVEQDKESNVHILLYDFISTLSDSLGLFATADYWYVKLYELDDFRDVVRGFYVANPWCSGY